MVAKTPAWADASAPPHQVGFGPVVGTTNGALPRAGRAAREFRDSLGTRRDAEDVMAAAIQARQQAAAYADEIIRHSEALAIQIEEEARESARIATIEAKRRAEQIVTDALVDAEHTAAEAEASAEKTRHEKEQHSAAVDEHTSST